MEWSLLVVVGCLVLRVFRGQVVGGSVLQGSTEVSLFEKLNSCSNISCDVTDDVIDDARCLVDVSNMTSGGQIYEEGIYICGNSSVWFVALTTCSCSVVHHDYADLSLFDGGLFWIANNSKLFLRNMSVVSLSTNNTSELCLVFKVLRDRDATNASSFISTRCYVIVGACLHRMKNNNKIVLIFR
ncbi:uncharacterized protein LOC144748726 [Ciona intestinalis]